MSLAVASVASAPTTAPPSKPKRVRKSKAAAAAQEVTAATTTSSTIPLPNGVPPVTTTTTEAPKKKRSRSKKPKADEADNKTVTPTVPGVAVVPTPPTAEAPAKPKKSRSRKAKTTDAPPAAVTATAPIPVVVVAGATDAAKPAKKRKSRAKSTAVTAAAPAPVAPPPTGMPPGATVPVPVPDGLATKKKRGKKAPVMHKCVVPGCNHEHEAPEVKKKFPQIRRPQAAYIYFSKKCHEDNKTETEKNKGKVGPDGKPLVSGLKFGDMSKDVSRRWTLLFQEAKVPFEIEAAKDRQRYNAEKAEAIAKLPPKKHRNSYVWYTEECRLIIKAEDAKTGVKRTSQSMTTEMADRWHKLTDDQKKPYEAKAEQSKKDYAVKLAEWEKKYGPAVAAAAATAPVPAAASSSSSSSSSSTSA